MIIRVEQGKGGKDRNVMLSPHLSLCCTQKALIVQSDLRSVLYR
jgi:hypothetical protein